MQVDQALYYSFKENKYIEIFGNSSKTLQKEEMDESEKAQISHRGKAVEVLQRKILGFSSE